MGQSARVTWPFLYFPGDRLSQTELMAARLDGHVVEIGEAFMPADAVETREMRAGSLRSILGSQLAATHESAAWVHGVRDEPPSRHHVQRCVDHRVAHVLDTRLHYRDLRLPPRDCVIIGGATVSTTNDRLALSRFVFEMGDIVHLDRVLNAVRRIDAVYDVYRVTSS